MVDLQAMPPVSKFQKIEIFEYPEMPCTESLADLSERFRELFPQSSDAMISGDEPAQSDAEPDAGNGLTGLPDLLKQDDLAPLVEAERNKAEERGRANGLKTGLAAGREEAARQLEIERDWFHAQAASLVTSFAEQRDQYFHEVEQNVVSLAMAIAARILRRETQMDPLLLSGAVRVALGQLAQSTVVRLRVPVQHQPLWEEALARMPGLVLRPQVIGDPSMEMGDCRIETELGSADLGLWAQLKEIERGFFDRVEDRDAAKPQYADASIAAAGFEPAVCREEI